MIDSHCAGPAVRKQGLTQALHGIAEVRDNTKSVRVAGPGGNGCLTDLPSNVQNYYAPLPRTQTIAIATRALRTHARSQLQPEPPNRR